MDIFPIKIILQYKFANAMILNAIIAHMKVWNINYVNHVIMRKDIIQK